MGATIPDSELQLDYLNIPINPNFHFASARKWNLNFIVTLGFLRKGAVDGEDVKDFYKSLELAL